MALKGLHRSPVLVDTVSDTEHRRLRKKYAIDTRDLRVLHGDNGVSLSNLAKQL